MTDIHIAQNGAPAQHLGQCRGLGDALGQMMANLDPLAAAVAPSAGEEAVDFLRALDADGWHNLVAIVPDGPPDGRTFPPGSWADIAKFVDERDGRANLYFSANEPAARAPNAKLGKSHIARPRVVHVDIDPADGEPLDAERARLRDMAERLGRGAVPPAFAIDSGGGVQLVWKLPEKLDAAAVEAVEAQNRGVSARLGGDTGTWNVDRLLRLPGTMNLPTKLKTTKGRTARRAAIMATSERRFDLEGLAKHFPPQAQTDTSSSADDAEISALMAELDHADFGEMSDDLRRRFDLASERNAPLRALWRGEKADGDKTGSGFRASLASTLGRIGGFDVNDFAALAWSWDFAVQPGDDRGAKLSPRDFARTWARCGLPAARERDAVAERHFEHVEQQVRNLWVDPSIWAGKSAPPREWLVEGLIPKGEVTLLFGDGGIGKTLLAQQYAICAAAGRSWLGVQTRPARVMLFLCEDRIEEVQRRHVDLCAALGVEVEATAGMRVCSRREEDNVLAVWNAAAGRMDPLPPLEQLISDAKAFRADVVVLDTLADIFGGKENERVQANAFAKKILGRIVTAIGGSVIVLGHPSQSGIQTGSGTSGSTGWNNAVRSRLYLKYPANGTGGPIRELESMKSNYGPAGSKFKLRWDRGAFAVVAATVPAATLSDRANFALPAVESIGDAAQRALCTAICARPTTRLNAIAPNSAFYAPKVLKRLEPELLAGWSEKELADALNDAVRRGVVEEVEIGVDRSRRKMFGLAIVADNMSEIGGVFD